MVNRERRSRTAYGRGGASPRGSSLSRRVPHTSDKPQVVVEEKGGRRGEELEKNRREKKGAKHINEEEEEKKKRSYRKH